MSGPSAGDPRLSSGDHITITAKSPWLMTLKIGERHDYRSVDILWSDWAELCEQATVRRQEALEKA